ncbi:MAG: prephenate dehydrogenase [Eubacteriales bacterium]|nr:prephenate dehydrogenase [Eubacteriales bacterium]
MITCGFIGLGLIGGSIARALKQNRNDIYIIACDPDPATLQLARSEGIADVAIPAPGAELGECDYIFLCAPVSRNDENLRHILSLRREGCILTDVGSVKAPIARLAEELGLTDCFIGGHPMAGSERVGFANSKAVLLENAYYIIAPAPAVPAGAVDAFRELVQSTGAIPLQIDSASHDYITAAVSHLPHIVAAALVQLVRDHDDAGGTMKSIAAGGFKDITRIASSSPVMWQQICLTNTVNISGLLQDYIDALSAVKGELDGREAAQLYDFFDHARAYRDSFIDAGSGPIKRAYFLRVDIPDEAGSLAAVATLLALNGINIKNIGITHNREAEEGVLRIEFYEEDAIGKAVRLLSGRGYVTHL